LTEDPKESNPQRSPRISVPQRGQESVAQGTP
jgi:hypothetical protein